MQINGKSYGGPSHTLEELISKLSQPNVKGWPVPLTQPVFRPDATVGPNDVGARVMVEGYCEGVVRFFGPHQSKPGMRAGVELDKPIGLNDGVVGGHPYFKCAPNHGVLVSQRKKVAEEEEKKTSGKVKNGMKTKDAYLVSFCIQVVPSKVWKIGNENRSGSAGTTTTASPERPTRPAAVVESSPPPPAPATAPPDTLPTSPTKP